MSIELVQGRNLTVRDHGLGLGEVLDVDGVRCTVENVWDTDKVEVDKNSVDGVACKRVKLPVFRDDTESLEEVLGKLKEGSGNRALQVQN